MTNGIGSGSEEVVRALLEAGADANRGSPLPICRTHDVNILRLLLKHGAKVDESNAAMVLSFHAAGLAESRKCVEEIIRTAHVTVSRDMARQMLRSALTSASNVPVIHMMIEMKLLNADVVNSQPPALIAAASLRLPDLVERLIVECGADPNEPDESSTPLCHVQEVQTAKVLLKHGASATGRGESVLCKMTRFVKERSADADEIVDVLLQAGADPNIGNPLAMACSAGRTRMVELLVAAKANINIPDSYGCTPLIRASESGLFPIVQAILRDPEAEVNVVANDGSTALCRSLGGKNWRNKEITLALLARGADPNLGEQPPLTCAAFHDDPAAVEHLLSVGARVNAVSPKYYATALHAAAQAESRVRTLAALLKAGADVTIRDSQGRTPLNCAGHANTIELLIKAGSDPNTIANDGQTPLSYCISCFEAIQALLKGGADPRKCPGAVARAAAYGYKNAVEAELDAGGDPNDCDPQGRPAITCGSVDIVKLLVARGADINKGKPAPIMHHLIQCSSSHNEVALYLLELGVDQRGLVEENGTTALHHAARVSNPQVTIELLKLSCLNPNAISSNSGCTAIGMANSVEIVRALLAAGADPNLGKVPPICAAAERGRLDIVQELVKAGAAIDRARSDDDANALCLATWNNHKEIVEFLVKHGADQSRVFPQPPRHHWY